jgi:alpha-amylase
MYAPEVLDSFRKLAKTGQVEFLAETYSHSLSSLRSPSEFAEQVNEHRAAIRRHFGVEPVTFRNTELIYSDGIGEMAAGLGFKAVLTEGARHILGWKSPNFLYCNTINPKLKVLMRNYHLSDDIAFRFSDRGWSEWPLTVEKYVDWLNKTDPKHEVINIFMDYETFGEHQWAETGIFNFMKALPKRVFSHSEFTFHTPSELADKLQPVSAVHVEEPISWADEERDLTAWLGNDLQDDAFDNLYALEAMVRASHDPEIRKDWRFLQASDHFYYMCTKWFSDGEVHKYFNPYGSPYEAYINYMNVLADFRLRLEKEQGTVPAFQNVSEKASVAKTPAKTTSTANAPVTGAGRKKPAKTAGVTTQKPTKPSGKEKSPAKARKPSSSKKSSR